MTTSQPPICDYEGSQYQDEFWEQGGRVYEDQAEAIALKRLLPKGGDLLLELGSGAGRNTQRYTGYKQIVLLDYSLTQLQQAMKRLGGNQRYVYVAADIYKLPFVDGLFDAATMIRTLHHLTDPQAALSQVYHSMHSGATFILEYANKQNLKAILRYITRQQDWSPFSLESIEFEKLNFDFHPKAVQGWLEAAGFKIQNELAVSSFRLGAFKKGMPLNLLLKMETWLQPAGAICKLSPSVFCRSLTRGDTPKAQHGIFFKCPACGDNNLKPNGHVILCGKCSRRYPIRDGIFDFRILPE